MLGTLPNGVLPWLHAKPLDAAIGQVPMPQCSSGCHGRQICCKTQNTNKTQFLASNYFTFLLKNRVAFVTQKGPYTHVIDVTSCVKLWDATIQGEHISYFSSYQTLTANKIRKVINLERSFLKKLVHTCATSG